jgi:LPS-assembly protein
VTRLTASADWLQDWTLAWGLRAQVRAGMAVDRFDIRDSGGLSRTQATEVTPRTALRLRWPLLKTGRGGATHLLEPMVQLAWSGGETPAVPNDESTRVEFDEGNLMALSRFPASDRRERGLTAAYGINWTRFDPDGWQSALTLGQVVREEPLVEPGGTGPSFTNSSGLQDRQSDLLVAGQFASAGGLSVTARGLFDDGFTTTKAAARAEWDTDRADIGATYIWLRSDQAENRNGNVSEWAVDGSYRLSRHWTGSAEWRYDVASDRSVRAGVGVTYTNECVEVDLSASRRFTSSTILEPSTDVSLTIGLRGFATRTRDDSYVRTCN